MIKYLFIILISLKTIAQVNTKTLAYLGNAEKSRLFVFERINGKVVSTGVLRFNTIDQSFNYHLDSQTVTLKGIFYNYWYLVKSFRQTVY